MSHNARTHNVLLKITVPKRTGRKRKRGSNGPWQGDIEVPDADGPPDSPGDKVCSIARLDDPKILQRKLQDNVEDYRVEPVGVIKHTHRFRAPADFYSDPRKTSLGRRYVDEVLPGNDGTRLLPLEEDVTDG